MDALIIHRIQFAFTITFHYLFPQLTMGLGLLIVILKTLAIRTGNELCIRQDSSHSTIGNPNLKSLSPHAS